MNNKTLIILGNGFDLDLGWKTSYADFYRAKQKDFEMYDRMGYIKDMIIGEHWYDLEGYIRNCIKNLSKNRAEELNLFWRMCRDRLFEYFTCDKLNIYTTNKESCAFLFLNKITQNSNIISFNYTNPFEKENIKNCAKDYLYIHGSLAEADHPYKLIIGVDKFVIDENYIAGEDLILPIIKSYENKNKERILQLLKDSENIIFYGHSLGQTDADYFQIFFEQIIKGNIKDRSIYLITKDEKGLQQMKNNLKKYSIEYDELALSGCDIIPIYTKDGKHSKDFSDILQII